ncbi:MAG TPA: DUF2304 domain-containing protein [Kineosporiaceae bacterium]|nr:DUF2304 domain-containing protein [Kineosporiaceae bacterium]
MTGIYPAALVLGLILLGIVVELLRRRQLREKYAALWLAVGIASLVLAIFPGLLVWTAHRLGFEVPANFLFLVAAVVMAAISMQLSLESGHLEDETQRLAEEVALLRLEVQRLSARDVAPSDAPPVTPATGGRGTGA